MAFLGSNSKTQYLYLVGIMCYNSFMVGGVKL